MIKEPQLPALQVVMKEARRAVKPLIWFSAGINVLMLTGAFYMLQVYHRVLSSHSLETLVMLSLMAAGALIAMAALEVVRARLLATVGAWMNARLAPVLLTASVEHAAAAPGQANARALRDLDQVRASSPARASSRSSTRRGRRSSSPPSSSCTRGWVGWRWAAASCCSRWRCSTSTSPASRWPRPAAHRRGPTHRPKKRSATPKSYRPWAC